MPSASRTRYVDTEVEGDHMATAYTFLGEPAVGKALHAAFEQHGWVYADDCATSDVVFTYATHLGAIEDAYFEQEGLIKQARPKSLLVDLSASTPSLAREIAAVATVSDLRFVEAPLALHDIARADAFAPDNLVCFIAGEEDDVAQAAEFMSWVAADVRTCGTAGRAELAKAAHTMQITAQAISVIESRALFDAVHDSSTSVDGLDVAVQLNDQTASGMLSALDEGRIEGSYTVALLMGDVVAAISAADDVDLIVPQLEASMHLLEMLAVIGGADMAPSALSLLYRPEEDGVAAGLDWNRAQGVFLPNEHDHHHEGIYEGDDSYDADDDDYDYGYDDDGYGYEGSIGQFYGGFSDN